MCFSAFAATLFIPSLAVGAVATGLALPGAGFAAWSGTAVGLPISLLACTVAVSAFLFATALWFATGNVLLPPTVWLGAAVAAASPHVWGAHFAQDSFVADGYLPLALGLLGASLSLVPERARTKPVAAPRTALIPFADKDELGLDDLKRLRLLLDRALQPIETFDGFERRDQFQTAAQRYQINFISYALSLTHARFTPAFTGYHAKAQQRLLAKQGLHRNWRYWRLENAWGSLSLNPDPVARDNIMFSGFALLQMALAGERELVLQRGNSEWRSYDANDIAAILARQYRDAPYGLLPCEPNWIYPLCNLITACGVRAADARMSTTRWPDLSKHFLTSLDREFTQSDGSFVAFRSSLIGFAPPPVGGAVMQAFPCLFLNALAPKLAEEHWHRFRQQFVGRSWRRAFWPIDVGNYGFSRASSYAASAAAAIELGDGEVAARLLELLDQECPSVERDGAIHRRSASLWAHALEAMARVGGRDGLRILVEKPTRIDQTRPHVICAGDEGTMIAKAKTLPGDRLDVVLRCQKAGWATINVAGLKPYRHYRTTDPSLPFFRADETGRAHLHLPVEGRLELTLSPVI